MPKKQPTVPPEIDIPNPGESEQFWIETDYSYKTRFWAKRFYPTDAAAADQEVQPKATTIFVHGFVEYIDRYRNIFKLWPSKGHAIVGFDQRGWGNTCRSSSEPVKNYGNTTWPQQFQDLEFVIRHTRQRLDQRWGANKVPISLLGHSMGGAVGVLRASRDGRIRLLVSLAGMVHTAAFNEREFGEVQPDSGYMWDEPECPLSQAYVDDVTSIHSVVDLARSIQIPWLLVHGSEDDVVPIGDSRDVIAANNGVELVELAGADHVFSEDATEPMVLCVVPWVASRLSG